METEITQKMSEITLLKDKFNQTIEQNNMWKEDTHQFLYLNDQKLVNMINENINLSQKLEKLENMYETSQEINDMANVELESYMN